MSTAFFMAWGNFLSLPCPRRVWDSSQKNMMLAFLPAIGAIIGALWCLAGMGLLALGLPAPFTALAMCFCLYALPGFMHLDGFMDVSDAVLSRRDRGERQRILKDSHVGSFAVIMLIFLTGATLLSIWAALDGFGAAGGAAGPGGFVSAQPPVHVAALAVIPVASRSVSGLCVLGFRPLVSSQYAEDHTEGSGAERRRAVRVLLFQVPIWLIASGAATMPLMLARGADTAAWAFLHAFLTELLLAAVTGLVTFISAARARHDLGGMNGDIAGFSICTGELAGLLLAGIWWSAV